MKNLSRATLFILILAVNPLDVIINEVAWMGTEVSHNDEWIELYNNTENSISLDGWQLTAQDGTPKINLSGTVPANGFYLLERTDDTTIPDVLADQIYTGALENTGETLELFDNSGNLIDRVNNSSGWFAGDNNTKQTMERKNPQLMGSDPNNWQTSQNPGGTAKTKNSLLIEAEPLSVEAQPLEIKQLAAAGEPIRQFPLLIALSMAIFSGIIILVLKNKVKIG